MPNDRRAAAQAVIAGIFDAVRVIEALVFPMAPGTTERIGDVQAGLTTARSIVVGEMDRGTVAWSIPPRTAGGCHEYALKITSCWSLELRAFRG